MKKIVIALALMLSAVAPVGLAAMPAVASQSIAAGEPTITAHRGSLELVCPPDGHAYTFFIYSITGQQVKQVHLTDGASAYVELPQGCYIVKCSAWSKKIIVG